MNRLFCCRTRVCSIVVVSLIVLAFQGCRSYIKELQPLKQWSPETIQDNEVLIGVALSGGGSRAALFGAAGLEELARIPIGQGDNQRSLLNDISYLSSVSGGSVAGSYFAMKKPTHDVTVLKADGDFTTPYKTFFQQYKSTMVENYEFAIELRQLNPLRWFNPSGRGASLAETLADRFLSGSTDKDSGQFPFTVMDLSKREIAGDSPRLIINTTLYNNGRRFAITTLPQEAFDFNLIQRVDNLLKTQPKPLNLPDSLKAAQTTLLPLTFQAPDVKVNPDTIALADAVAASASVPLLLGPITSHIEGKPGYFHAGDGGLFDNQGTESLVEAFLKKLQDGKNSGRHKGALIIALDSSLPFWISNQPLTEEDNGNKVFADDPARISGIMEQRANAYQALLWHILQSDGQVIPQNIKVIVIRHTDDVWSGALPKDIQDVCDEEKVSLLNAAGQVDGKKVGQRLAHIPTRFQIKSICDQKLLEAAAARAVKRKRGEILQFLKEIGDQ